MKHANMAFFVPHLGCPHACSFCNQRRISGREAGPSPKAVEETLAEARKQLGGRVSNAQIAFFGGSFTAVEAGYRKALLEAAQPFLGAEGFQGIRISTRPDAVDGEVLEELRAYGVTDIELGAQSMDDEVLRRSRRGHTAEDVRRASRLIREQGFSLGLQMMTGLPGDSVEGSLSTALQLAELEPDTMRIYPTLVLRDTALAEQYRAGVYTPPSLEEAVDLCAQLLAFFVERGIRVIRLGLHDHGLKRDVLAGPRHPAFRELCEGKLLLEKALGQLQLLRQLPAGETRAVRLLVHPRSISKMAGQKRANLHYLTELGWRAKLEGDDSLAPLDVTVQPLWPDEHIS